MGLVKSGLSRAPTPVDDYLVVLQSAAAASAPRHEREKSRFASVEGLPKAQQAKKEQRAGKKPNKQVA